MASEVMAINSQHSDQRRQREQRASEEQILAVVEAMARELNPRRRIHVQLNSSLQRDLGFDSLGLSELIMRSEKAFQVRLPDDLLGRLETPRDLFDEVIKSGGSGAATISRRSSILPGTLTEAIPENRETLPDILDWHVEHHGERAHILLSDGYSETETITYRNLSDTARQLAGAMQAWGLEPGDSVGIMLPTGRDFFQSYFAVMLAGGVPVPMYPPMRITQLEEHLKRQVKILQNAQARLLLVPSEGKALAALVQGRVGTLRAVLTVEDLAARHGDFDPVLRGSADLAMLQYTSGSTGDPKGVMLTHANLLANIRAMGRAIKATSKDVFVSWLPLYHDLGLIGAWFGSLYHAVPVIIMSPLRFIVRPESWLWAIHRNAGTLSAAPNFGFELCVNRIDENALQGLDLSSLRLVANGAEPVSAETIRRFTERFERYGFRADAMAPVYGLAENSVGLAFSPLGEKPNVERIARVPLSQSGKASLAADDDANPMSFVSSGVPLPDHQIRIVDDLGHELPDREVGRLEFKGPSATSGYFRNPDKSSALFHGTWLDSGDLAYVAGGHVFITGRVKDIIIKGGRNIYPQEIEEVVGDLAGVRKGCVAAFASADPETAAERLIVVAETRSTDPETVTLLQQDVAAAVTDILDLPADGIELVAPHVIPKTSSGKIRRSAAKELFEAGRLGQPARAVWLQVLRLRWNALFARLRRSSATIGEHAYAGWFWSVLVAFGAVTWIGVMLLPQRSMRWAFVRAMAQGVLTLMFVPVRVSGKAYLSARKGIIVANHSSYSDALVLSASLIGEPVFIAKAELSEQLVAGPFLRRLGVLFAERRSTEAGVEEAQDYAAKAREGQQLVFFPEATFFRNPGLLPFRMGAFSVACTSGLPVIPIAISGTRSLLRGEQWFPRRGKVSVRISKPVTPDGDDFAAAIRLRDAVRSTILAHCGEPDMSERAVTFADANDQRAVDRR